MAEVKERKSNKRQKTMEKTKNKQQTPEENDNKTEEKENVVKEEKEEKKITEEKTERLHNNKKRKRKENFPFGNYRSYYGYRLGQGMEEDPRIKVLKREWFEGKDCLDIGCNSGVFTIQIAKKFHCRRILGIDIDSDQITDAYWHLRKFVRAGQAGRNITESSKPEVTENVNVSENLATPLSVEKREIMKNGLHSEKIDLFDIVSFRKENFVQSSRRPEEQYDTILCLSVTKWIHLNWGDNGLITLFSKIWKLLRPVISLNKLLFLCHIISVLSKMPFYLEQGGILVLEPQPWRSYEKNRLVSETATMNFRNIIYRPRQFKEILLDKIGFRRAEDITSALSGSKAGFDRPIFVYYK